MLGDDLVNVKSRNYEHLTLVLPSAYVSQILEGPRRNNNASSLISATCMPIATSSGRWYPKWFDNFDKHTPVCETRRTEGSEANRLEKRVLPESTRQGVEGRSHGG